MPLKCEPMEEPSLNLTPMIDIVFNLIIFFMVAARFSELERQFDVALPTVSDAQPLTDQPDEIVVNVREDGTVFVADKVRTLAQLENDLRTAKARFAEQAVVVRAAGVGPYQHVMDVLAVCHRTGITQVSLANRLAAEGTP